MHLDSKKEWGKEAVLFLVILFIGAFLRVWGLTGESVWWDEYTSLMHLEAPSLGAFLSLNRTLDPATLPLYYSLEYLFAQHLSSSVLALRLCSVFLGLLSLGVIYRLGRRLYSPGAGLFAAAAMACSPIHVFHAQGIRMYVLFTLLALCSMHAFWNWVDRGKLWDWIAVSLCNLLLFWTHPFAAFLVVVQGVFLLLAWPVSLRKTLLWGGLHALLVLPSSYYFSTVRFWGKEETGAWLSLPSPSAFLGDLFFDDLVRSAYQLRVEEEPLLYFPFHLGRFFQLLRPLLDSVLVIFVLACLVAILFRLARSVGKKKDPAQQKSERSKIFLLLLWWLLPPALLLAISFLFRPCLFPRYTLYASLAFYLLVGGLISRIAKTAWRRLLMATFLMLLLYQSALVRGAPQRTDWQSAAELLEEQAQEDDVVLVHVSIWKEVFQYNLGEYRHPMASAEKTPVLAEAAAFALALERPPEKRISEPPQLWVLIPSAYFDGGPDLAFEEAAAALGLAWEYFELPGIKHLRIYCLKRAEAAQSNPAFQSQRGSQEYIQCFGDLGIAFADQGEYENALQAIRHTIDGEATADPVYGRLLQALESGEDIPERIAAVKALLRGYRFHRDYAATAFREAIEHDPAYAVAYAELGVALAETGEERQALAALEEAGRLDGEFHIRYARLCAVLAEGGDVQATLSAFQDFLGGLGALFSGDLVQAESVFHKSLEKDARFALSEIGLGLTALAAGDPEQASESFRKALATDPILEEYWGKAFQAIFVEQDYEKAQTEAVRLEAAGVELPGPILRYLDEVLATADSSN